jgi:uncharacterized protein YndB with AHSA1/START domain
MTPAFERTFTVEVPLERAWAAFADSAERSQWEAATYEIDPTPGGRVRWELPGLEATGEVVEVVPNKLLRHVEGSGPHTNAEVTVRFEAVDGGTSITITHAGFGDAAHWDEWLEGTAIGWSQAIADLVVYLRTGVPARRFVAAMQSPGMTMRDGDGGVEVASVSVGALADQAGLEAGDLLLRVGGVPVFAITDVWVLMREHGTGTELEVEYLRSDQRRHGKGRLVSFSDLQVR